MLNTKNTTPKGDIAVIKKSTDEEYSNWPYYKRRHLTVWNVLLDFERHPSWNPFIKSIKGEQIVGKKSTRIHQTSRWKRNDIQTLFI